MSTISVRIDESLVDAARAAAVRLGTTLKLKPFVIVR